MKKAGRKVVEEVIGWAVPAACAALMLLWKRVPEEMRHYWPVMCLAVMCLCSLALEGQTRSEVRKLRRIHEEADKRAEETKKRDSDIASAFKAMLDDDMGKLYVSCLQQGYTTEDERRRYRRLDMAYKDMGGNGEAAERKERFFAIMPEEEWKLKKERMK